MCFIKHFDSIPEQIFDDEYNIQVGVTWPRFESQVCHLQVVGTWGNYSTSLCLSFLICKKE